MRKIIPFLIFIFFAGCYEPEALESLRGSIKVSSTPSEARIYLDGEDTGKETPATLEEVLKGKHMIKLTKEGYASYSAEVTVESGKQATVNATLGKDIEWCHVPAGWFTMGSDDSDADSDEAPVHQVYLDGYYISKYEVTNAKYVKFLNAIKNKITTKAGGEGIKLYYDDNPIYYIPMNGKWNDQIGMVGDADSFYVKSGYENYPVIHVTWYGAKAFCEYYGWRLPTEAEWEKAARGTDKRKYPWGNHDPYYNGKYYANYDPGDDDANGYKYTAPVGSYPDGASPYGCMDMAGNVWEWCNDWYDSDSYSYSPDHNPEGPSSGSGRVRRGGSWYNDAGCIRCADRVNDSPSTSSGNVGFRPVRNE